MPFGKDLSPDTGDGLIETWTTPSHQCLSAKTCLPTAKGELTGGKVIKSPMPFGKDLSPDGKTDTSGLLADIMSPMPFGKDLSPD